MKSLSNNIDSSMLILTFNLESGVAPLSCKIYIETKHTGNQ